MPASKKEKIPNVNLAETMHGMQGQIPNTDRVHTASFSDDQSHAAVSLYRTCKVDDLLVVLTSQAVAGYVIHNPTDQKMPWIQIMVATLCVTGRHEQVERASLHGLVAELGRKDGSKRWSGSA